MALLPVGTPAVTPVPPLPEHANARAAAEAALTHAMERPLEAPAYYACVVRRQDGTVTTRDTVEHAVRVAQAARQTRVDMSGLNVGMIFSDQTGTAFLIEGLRRV